MGLPESLIKDVSNTSSTDWAKYAGLNWTAEKKPLFYNPGDGSNRKGSKIAIIRSDTGKQLGIVGPNYKIVQPSHVLEGFENTVRALGTGFRMDGIGLFDDGRVIWGRASSDMQVRIKGQDVINSYLYMVTSFDSSVATIGFVSTLRAVCSNTLHIDYRRSGKLFYTPHRREYQEQSENVLDAYVRIYSQFEKDANMLADVHIDAKDVVSCYKGLLYPGKKELSARANTALGRYLLAATQGKGSCLDSVGLDGKGGMSAWGLVNGITYVVDHDPIRKTDVSGMSNFLGSSNKLKDRAWAAAMRLATL